MRKTKYILNRNLIRKTLIAFISLLIFQVGYTYPSQKSVFDEMSHTEVLKMTLAFDVVTVQNSIRSKENFPAQLSFTNAAGELSTWNTKVSIRGKFRRMKCKSIPPLKINFKKRELEEAGLAKFDDMKLVPHCVEDKELAKEWILKEYLAYKIYNEITTTSYRVQLLEITYKDIKSGNEDTQFAFLIEDTAELRARIQAEKQKVKFNLPYDQFNHEQIKTVALFEYMIGNADWDLSSAKNIKILNQNDQFIAIPYDFDFSGIVSAGYAIANSSLGIRSVKERIYLGFEQDLEDNAATIELFKNKKEAIFTLVKNFKPLKKSARRDILKYLTSFYENTDLIVTKKVIAENLTASKNE